jgi:hypothetical protein
MFTEAEAGIAHSIWRLVTGSMDGIQFPAGAIYFFLLHSVQNDPGAHPSQYPMETGGSFSVDKAAES